MKALVVDDYGPPQNARVLDMEVPKVEDGMLLVRMRAAAVNPFDYKVVTGMAKSFMSVKFPYIPGMDGTGEIAEVGSGVEGWSRGDAVVGMFPSGAFAEYALISAKEKKLARKPVALDFADAAAIPQSGMTAKTMLRAAGLQAGQTVFIVGATGGIGLFATQLAKAEHARVIATGKPQDETYLRELGADDFVDYTEGDPIAKTRERFPRGVDVVLDVVNSGEKLLRDADVLRESGTLVSPLYGPEQDAFGNQLNVRYVQLTAQDGDLDDLVRRAANQSMRVEIGKLYDLSQAAEALADLSDSAKHTRGKLVIHIS